MIAVADTGPLNYLILIKAADVLPLLYGSVVVPQKGIAELIDPRTPATNAQLDRAGAFMASYQGGPAS